MTHCAWVVVAGPSVRSARVVAIETGQLIAGRYRLAERVGNGAMGVVWRATDERLARVVAIKHLLLRPGLSEDESRQARQRAMREARIAARLQHPNAVAMYDVAEHNGDPCLVMEYVPAPSLSAVLAEHGTLPPARVAEIGAKIAAALATAHQVGITHRDIKPGNVLLDDEGTVKITDFGISRAADDGTATQTGMLAGTPAYLAPEIARGSNPSQAADVFALGATLYHAVEGTPPFGLDENPLALLHAVASGAVTPPRLAGGLTGPLMTLLRPTPGERPTMAGAAALLSAPDVHDETVPALRLPSSEKAAERTQRIAPTAAVEKSTAGLPPSAAPRADRGRFLVLGGIAMLTVAGIVAAMLISLRSPSTSGAATGPSSTAARPSTTSPTPTTTTAAVSGPINWSQAGELVIDYYSSTDTAARWRMLSPAGQAVFGDERAFADYWSTFTGIGARNARGVTPNADGSVTVPVDVTLTGPAGSAETKKTVRVAIVDGRLLIDSDSR